MLPVNRYLAMNIFCRSMTCYQKSYSSGADSGGGGGGTPKIGKNMIFLA